MNALAEKKQLDAALDEYRRRLDTIPDERFTETPPGGGWSYAEVYNHILQADLGSSIAMQKCMQGNRPQDGRKPNLFGRLVLLSGYMPRQQSPGDVAAAMPARKISREEARNLLVKCRRRISDLVPLLEDASTECTIAHPRLGYLNAGQWLRFIAIHTRHHLKQLQRIDRAFARA